LSFFVKSYFVLKKGLFNFLIFGVSLRFILIFYSVCGAGFRRNLLRFIKFFLKEYQLGGAVYFLIFYTILFRNCLRLFAMVPPITANISFVLMIRLRGWTRAQYKKLKFLKVFFSHMIPVGSPFLLVFFLFSVEVFRLFIQSITLTVRLIANILAGHLLMALILEGAGERSLGLLLAGRLIFLELIVSFVQALVFLILLVFYSR